MDPARPALIALGYDRSFERLGSDARSSSGSGEHTGAGQPSPGLAGAVLWPEVHHEVDPSTGRPTTTGAAAASVVATSGRWAEAATEVLAVAGEAGLEHTREVAALVFRSGGAWRTSPELAGTILRD